MNADGFNVPERSTCRGDIGEPRQRPPGSETKPCRHRLHGNLGVPEDNAPHDTDCVGGADRAMVCREDTEMPDIFGELGDAPIFVITAY